MQATVPPVEDTLLREVDLRQLVEKAQLSGELVTMCLESVFELQAGTYDLYIYVNIVI